jgi:Asp-tRNA(Asn)/Glu-tRNA(Gln) amidotransferase A subunit family amidase
MYLARLKKHGPALNCVVTLTEDLALGQAAQADKEIKAGRYRGPLHGIPWGAKDLIATKGILTTWGAAPYQNQVFDYDATVVERLRDAGAVLAAKLSLGALAQGDNWFRGQTKNPWTGRGSSGSSAGPGSATAAGLVDHLAVGGERRRRPQADLRPREPARRHGLELDDGQDRADVPVGRGLRARVQRDLRP